MSEQTTQTSVSRPKGNVFTNKVGPLPLWSWMAILLVAVLLYSFYKKSSSNNSPAAQAAGNAPGGVDASLVPQFINQTYENETPPAAPNVTVNNTVPPPVVVPPARPPTPPREPKEPSTISGAPGSFTTGLPGGLNEWTSTGKYSLNVIAKSHGMTPQQLIKVSEASENNPALKAYVAKKNYNAPVPAGVQLFFPNANWAVRK
jgi:hypothetical protein